MIESVLKDNSKKKVTDILLLKTKDIVTFFDIDCKSILEGEIVAFGDKTKCQRIKAVLQNEAIAKHDANIMKSDYTNYIASLEGKIKALQLQLNESMAENQILKSKFNEFNEHKNSLVRFLQLAEQVKKKFNGPQEISLNVFFIILYTVNHSLL